MTSPDAACAAIPFHPAGPASAAQYPPQDPVELLATRFAALRETMGAERFASACATYLATWSAPDGHVRRTGEHFAGFLADRAAPEPWSELAAFEWALCEAAEAPRADLLQPADLERIPPHEWRGLRLLLHPAVRSLRLRWNVAEQVCAHRAGKPPPSPGQANASWVLWRRDQALHWRKLGSDEAIAFDAAEDDGGFREICRRLQVQAALPADQASRRTEALLRQWVEEQWITDIELESDGHWLLFAGQPSGGS